jgi:hypothetical protein
MGLVRDSAIECILKLTMGMVLVSDKAARYRGHRVGILSDCYFFSWRVH